MYGGWASFGYKVIAKSVPSHLFLIVFDAILLANHVTITRSKRENDVMYRSELYFNETHSVYDHLFTSKLFVYIIKKRFIRWKSRVKSIE